MPRLWQPGKVNSVEIKEPLSQHEMMTGLLLPLYAGRAVEEMFYGPQGVTLSTAAEVSHNSHNLWFVCPKEKLLDPISACHYQGACTNLMIGFLSRQKVQRVMTLHDA